MDSARLNKHIEKYVAHLSVQDEKHRGEMRNRQEQTAFYQSWNKDRILKINEAALYEYIARLWAMLIWGNKQYVVDNLLQNHGLETIRKELAELVWGSSPVAKRWDHFRKSIKGIGPAMMSEILCNVHPETCVLWNRRAYVGFQYLGFNNLPRYTYQLTGKKYEELSASAQTIAEELRKAGVKDANLLSVDYFIWDELQVLDNLTDTFKSPPPAPKVLSEEPNGETLQFIHNEIRDKLADIGRWLGFETSTEIKVAEGSKVDTVWEATIGNMGRVIYVFEVQTKGSIDSLILNLLKSLNNPAVQGVVAVSDAEQLNKIRKHAETVGDLGKKLRCWDYLEVLQNHEALEAVNESINRLGLVPQGF